MEAIEAGQFYWVMVENVRFRVKAIRPSAVKDWWLCETEKAGDRLMMPAKVLVAVTAENQDKV